MGLTFDAGKPNGECQIKGVGTAFYVEIHMSNKILATLMVIPLAMIQIAAFIEGFLEYPAGTLLPYGIWIAFELFMFVFVIWGAVRLFNLPDPRKQSDQE